MGEQSEWLTYRKGGITGSDAAAIMGVGRKTAYRVWLEKTGRVEPPDLDNLEHIYWGNRLEPVVLSEVEKKTDRTVTHTNLDLPGFAPRNLQHGDGYRVMWQSVEHDWLRVTPDGVCLGWMPLPWLEEQETLEGYGLLEAKTCGIQFAKDWEGSPPDYYVPQVITNAICGGLEWGCIAVLIGGQEFRMFDIPVSASTRQQYLDKLGRFWDYHVQGDRQPDLAPGDAETVKGIYPTSNGTEIEIAQDLIHADAELVQVKAALSELKKSKDVLEARIRDAIGGAEVARIADSRVLYTLKETTVEEHSVGTSTFRVLRRKELKAD